MSFNASNPTPFPAYREMVKRSFADMKLVRLRLDYMTGLYLRYAGYMKAEEMERERIHHETRERRARPAFRLR